MERFCKYVSLLHIHNRSTYIINTNILGDKTGCPPPLLFTADVIIYILTVTSALSKIYSREILAVYQQHRTKLLPKRIGVPPTHAIQIHYNPLPVKLHIRPLRQTISQLSNFNYQLCVDDVKNNESRDLILVYTELYQGTDTQMASVFDAVSVKKLMEPVCEVYTYMRAPFSNT